MDLLLSLLCGALGGFAAGGLIPRARLGQVLEALFGLGGGYLGLLAMDGLQIGLAHRPAPGGALEMTTLGMHIAVSFGAGMLMVAMLGLIRARLHR